jgi:hypothetical protein
VWLDDGRALQDLLGDGFTLLDLAGQCQTGSLEAAFGKLGVPLDVIRLDEPHIRKVYNCTALLLRPDLHIAWRGDNAPDDAEALAVRASGWDKSLNRQQE